MTRSYLQHRFRGALLGTAVFSDAVRAATQMGGDTDTVAAMGL